MAGRFDEARDLVDRSGVVLDELNQIAASWAYRSIAAEAKELIGDRAGAEQDLMAKWHRFRDLGDHTPDARAMHSAYELALLYCDDGRWDDAEPAASTTAARSRRRAYFRARGRARPCRAREDRRRTVASSTSAGRLARQAVELAEQSDMLNLRARVWCALAEVLRHRRRRSRRGRRRGGGTAALRAEGERHGRRITPRCETTRQCDDGPTEGRRRASSTCASDSARPARLRLERDGSGDLVAGGLHRRRVAGDRAAGR